MKTRDLRRAGAALVCGLAACAGARAQQPMVNYTISVIDGPGSNGNGVIEPGESALVSVSVSFTPPVGSPISYTPPPGTGMGTVAGLASVAFDITADCEHDGGWNIDPLHGYGPAAGWRSGPIGTVEADGDVVECHAGQVIAPGAIANSANPVAPIWRGIWTPHVYLTPGDQLTFMLRPAASAGANHSALVVQYDTDPNGRPLYTTVFVGAHFGTCQIGTAGGPPPYPCRCYANCDGSLTTPFLNVNDFVCFQNRFAAGDTRANCDHSTTPPVLNVNDFVCYMNEFARQCL